MGRPRISGPVRICNCTSHAWQTIGKAGVILVSPEDASLLTNYAWHAQPSKKLLYASTGGGTSSSIPKSVTLHVMISGKNTDHKNRNGLDNRRENLRPATRSQQNINRKMKSETGLRGVVKAKSGAYVAQLSHEGKSLLHKRFKTKEEAATAYDDAARQHHGEFAILNFP